MSAVNELKTLRLESVEQQNKEDEFRNSDSLMSNTVAIKSEDIIRFRPVGSEWQSKISAGLKIPVSKILTNTPPKEVLISQPPKLCISINGDGNCLFATLSYFIPGEPDQYSQVRDRICVYIRNRFLEVAVDSNYLSSSKMESDGVWGTDIEIKAACNMLKTRIFVYSKYKESFRWNLFEPNQFSNIGSDESMYINHFDYSGMGSKPNHFEPVFCI